MPGAWLKVSTQSANQPVITAGKGLKRTSAADAIDICFGMTDWNNKYVKGKTKWDGEANYPLTLQ